MIEAEVVGPAEISPDMLKDLFEEAGMKAAIDSDGDLAVTAGATCYVLPTRPGDRIQLLAFLSTNEESTLADRAAFANRVNNDISTVRARVNRNDSLVFDYHIPVDGGITPRAIVLATRFFLQAAVAAVDQCDTANVVK